MSVLGWRQWAVDRAGRLRPAWSPWSALRPDVLLWRPDGPTRAVCLRWETRHEQWPAGGARGLPPHPPTPCERCRCGLYAYRTADVLRGVATPTWTSCPIVVGAARLGGRLIVGEHGYRAELGYPVAVLDRDGVVAPAYRVARYRTWEALVGEWSAPDQAA